jgi:hypothetical protein
LKCVVVGITGYARSGKDTAAKLLAARHGFTRVALADGVREAFSSLDGPTWEARKALDSSGRTAREELQWLGTEARQHLGCSDHWVDHLKLKIYYAHERLGHRLFVVPDIRYAFEAWRFKQWLRNDLACHYETWRVSRGTGGPASDHLSETQIDKIPISVMINNDGTLGALALSVLSEGQRLVDMLR